MSLGTANRPGLIQAMPAPPCELIVLIEFEALMCDSIQAWGQIGTKSYVEKSSTAGTLDAIRCVRFVCRSS